MWINIIEDEKNLNAIISTYLEKEGYSVRSFLNGNDGLEAVGLETDLWIIDIMLPDTNGFTIFKKVKEITPEAYIIFISARNQDIDRVVGLEMGCDDYISKPFMTRELIIRVNKILKAQPKKQNIMKAGNCIIYLDRHKVFQNDTEVEMSSKEYDVLVYFVNNPNIALSRERILERIWDGAYGGSQRVVDDTIRRIRKKIPELKIETVYGYGYSYET